MSSFINRNQELEFLNKEYLRQGSSLVVVYGRRRIGKTSLIREFLKDKRGLYYLASEESELQNLKHFKSLVGDYVENPLVSKADLTWDETFELVGNYRSSEKKIVVIDEFQYLGKANKSFPSIFQRIWDNSLQFENVMVILCGSLINMMISQTLSHKSPLYGRRTGQIKMKQIDFEHYSHFYAEKRPTELMEYYSVTGGVPKYIELFRESCDVYQAIEENILSYGSFLYEEPIFLLEKEVGEIGTYFSIIKTIAAGNHKLGKIAGSLEVNQTSLTKYLSTLMDLDLVERIVPITEDNPEKSKKGLYHIKDNFIDFWFKFIYPYRSYIEMGNTKEVLNRLKRNFIDSHVAFVFEDICKEKTWRLVADAYFDFEISRIGKWWDGNNEIDIVTLSESSGDILFGECKYWEKSVDVDVLYSLIEKSKTVKWRNNNRQEHFAIYSKSGFTERLLEIAGEREDVYLVDMSK